MKCTNTYKLDFYRSRIPVFMIRKDGKIIIKKVVVRWSRLRDPSGPAVRRPVILPPLEADSIRCSVKPASRNACHSREPWGQSFRSSPAGPTTQLGTGGPSMALPTQARRAIRQRPHHLNAPARVTSSRCWARREVAARSCYLSCAVWS